jgi:hypothetical protein
MFFVLFFIMGLIQYVILTLKLIGCIDRLVLVNSDLANLDFSFDDVYRYIFL